MNETLKMIAKRYSCRDFTDKVPGNELIKAIADAAIQSPSARNFQPWRVIVVKDRDLMKDMEAEGLVTLAKMEDKTAYNNVINRGGHIFYNAPCMIIIAINHDESHYASIDCGIVCQSITVAATSLGVDSLICGSTRNVFANPEKSAELGKRLGFPEGYEFGCSVLLGYANTTKEPHLPDEDKIIFID